MLIAKWFKRSNGADLIRTAATLAFAAILAASAATTVHAAPLAQQGEGDVLTDAVLDNATYVVQEMGNQAVTLSGGRYSEPIAGAATEWQVWLLDLRARGDITGDYRQDAAVIYVVNGGGSGNFVHLGVMENQAGEAVHVASVLLGDRVDVRDLYIGEAGGAEQRTIVVEMIEQGPDDPLCCPTQHVRKRFGFVNGALTLLSQETLPPPSDLPGGNDTTTYIVQPGDSLTQIARLYCTTWRAIYSANEALIGANPSVIQPGAALTVSDQCGNDAGDGDTGDGEAGDGTPDINPGGTASGVWDRGTQPNATGTWSPPNYTVAAGDTLTSIGERFGVSAADLRATNNLDGNLIVPGQVLRLPGVSAEPAPQEPESGTLQRVSFAPGAERATRNATIYQAIPVGFVLNLDGGVMLEVRTDTGAVPLEVSVLDASGNELALSGTNGQVGNLVTTEIGAAGDYTVMVAPAGSPESPTLDFEITFIIR